MAALAIPLSKVASTRLVDVADAAESAMSRAVLVWLRSFTAASTRQSIQASFMGGGLQPRESSPHDVFVRTMSRGADFAIEALSHKRIRKFQSIGATMSFTMTNDQVVAFLQSYTFGLITNISTEVIATLRTVLTSAVLQGISPREQSRVIEPLIGLTSRQATAALNFRQGLETGNYRAVLDRALRDRRYDSTVLRQLRNGEGLSKSQIDRMVERYTERSLRHRALMIARTETIRAANAGQVEAWRQAQTQGLLTGAERMHWIVATDERACPICKEIPRMNPNGVAIGGHFQTPNGIARMPPDPHPSCRCALSL